MKREREETLLQPGESEAELAGMKLIHEVSAELIHEQDVDALYRKVLDAAVAVMRSDFGSMQMFYPERGQKGELRLLAFHGFDPESAKFWEWVRADSGCTCGAVLRTGGRVIASDVATCDFMAGTPDREALLKAGMLAAQSTPLKSREGKLVGMISTHWRAPHQPTPGELRLLDILARQAADLIERNRAEGERRKAQEALRESHRQLEDADRLKDEFIAMLAHELRNPLAAIGMGADLLGRSPIADERARFAVSAIARQAKQLRRLSDDLLDLARVSHGKLVLRRRPLDLAAVAKSIAADYASLLHEGVTLRAEGDECWVDADPARVRQMIGNLIDNATKYGGRTIAIRVAREGGKGLIEVADDGQGIAPELLESLFRPFVQGAQPLDRDQGGLGLGLALVDRLAALHGGGIEARSEGRGKGSSFVLSLPAAARPAAAGGVAGELAMAPLRILVIEDEDDSRQCLRMLLETDGHEVWLARDGADGLAKFAEVRPQVALVDVGLPGMDGYEVVRRVRRLNGGSEARIIAVSGYAGERHAMQARDAGCDLHVTKPVSYEHLRRLLA